MTNGFLLDEGIAPIIDIREVAGGWMKVLDAFEDIYLREMVMYPRRFMILPRDFDGEGDERLAYVRSRIRSDVSDRVFVLGAKNEPQDLKHLGSLETIGRKLAKDCREGTDYTWNDADLVHNAGELARLRDRVRPILFPKP